MSDYIYEVVNVEQLVTATVTNRINGKQEAFEVFCEFDGNDLDRANQFIRYHKQRQQMIDLLKSFSVNITQGKGFYYETPGIPEEDFPELADAILNTVG